jgi:copper chaperone
MVVFRVDDMTCGHCAGMLARALAEVDKGARVEFDMPRRLVQVQPQAASADELKAAMEEAGYHPVIEAATLQAASPAGGCGCGCGSRRADTTDRG